MKPLNLHGRRTFLAGTLGAAAALSLPRVLGGCAGPAQTPPPGRALETTQSIRYNPRGPVVLLGAHCDDVPFHCWHYLTKVRPLQVADLFMSAPPEGTMATDERMGRYEVAQYMRERHTEEKEALARAGVGPAKILSGFDMPYRSAELPNLGTLANELAIAIPEASRLVAPLGLGNRIRVGTNAYSHVDHKFVRDVADSFGGIPKTYYAEVYALSKHSSDYNELLDHMKSYKHWTMTRVDLSPDEIRKKREALGAYRSQMAGLLADIPDIMSDGFLGTELYWTPT